MATARDREIARSFLQNDIATSAYQGAEKTLTESIFRNPDALLALELQRMEVKTPFPPVIDEDSERVAWQLQEQEQFEQEQHDADVAQRMMAEDQRSHGHHRNGRVDRLGEALEEMERTSPSPTGMNFGRSVRGPSMMGTLGSDVELSVFGPASLVEHPFDNDTTILPPPRPRHRGIPGRLAVDRPNQGQMERREDEDHLARLPGQVRPPHRGNINHDDRQNQFRRNVQNPLLPGQHRIGGLLGMLRARGRDIEVDGDFDSNDYETLWELQERNGDVVRKGLTPQQIGRLPYYNYKSKPRTSSSNGNDCCRICLCEYKEGEKIRTLTCLHSYHKDCIDKWLKSQAVCPVCRENIRTN